MATRMADAIANGSQWASVIKKISLKSRSDLSTNFREVQDEPPGRTFAARPVSFRHGFYSSFATCDRAFSPIASVTLCASHQVELKHLASHLIAYSRKREYGLQTFVGQSDADKPARWSRLNMQSFPRCYSCASPHRGDCDNPPLLQSHTRHACSSAQFF